MNKLTHEVEGVHNQSSLQWPGWEGRGGEGRGGETRERERHCTYCEENNSATISKSKPRPQACHKTLFHDQPGDETRFVDCQSKVRDYQFFVSVIQPVVTEYQKLTITVSILAWPEEGREGGTRVGGRG